LLGPTLAHPAEPHKLSCGQTSYTRAEFHRTVRKALRSFPYTANEQRAVRCVVFKQAYAKSVPIVRYHARRYRAAFERRFYWQIRWARVSPGLKSRLARLRHCESTNNPRASNGSHWGYYQYDVRTWGEAQSWAGVPPARRTARADFAAPIHQNVVTASFFPANTGRWACSA
jgi:hypothetical protein